MNFDSLAADKSASKWIAIESIYHLRSTGLLMNKDQGLNTKLHKIIFKVASDHDIPISRGWYIHGPFIWNYDTLKRDYKEFIREEFKRKQEPNRWRKKISKLGINVDDILDDILITSEKFYEMTSDECVKYFYDHEAPDNFKNIFLSKYGLSGFSSNFSVLSRYYHPYYSQYTDLDSYIKNIHNDIDSFERRSFNVFNDETLESNTLQFFNVLRDMLWKFELGDFNKVKSNFIDKAQSIFINFVWSPYAGLIFKETAVGRATNNIKDRGRKTRREAIEKFPLMLKSFDEDRKNMDFYTVYDDMKTIFNKEEDKELSKKLWELTKLSSGVN